MKDDQPQAATRSYDRLIEVGESAVAAERDEAAKIIVLWMQRRDVLLEKGDDLSGVDARDAIADLLSNLQTICAPLMGHAFEGADTYLTRFHRTGTEEEREAQLTLLRHRIRMTGGLFDRPGSRLATFEVLEELFALSAGDSPRMFSSLKSKRKSGLPNNAWRLASLQLRALEWDLVLKCRGEAPGVRHMKIQNAFGVEWGTIRKWRRPCEASLGARWVNNALRDAEVSGKAGDLVFAETLDVDDPLGLDGLAYRQELKLR